MFALVFCIAIATARIYTVSFPSLGPLGGAPGNTFYGRLENTGGTTTEVFEFTGTCLADSSNTPCTYTPDLTDIGDASQLKYLYMMTRGSNALLVDEIEVETWFVDETFSITTFEYTEASSFPDGCEVLIADLPGDDLQTTTETPTCATFPPTSQATSHPIVPSNPPSSTGHIPYDVSITLALEGGSTDAFYLIIKGNNGETSPYTINDMTDGPNTYSYQMIDVDVGTITYAYLVSYGSDELVVSGIVINTIYSVSEWTGDWLAYSDNNAFGCEVLVVDFASDEMTIEQQKPCGVIPPVDVTHSVYRVYAIQVKVANYGGSVNDIFAAIESINGNRTEFVNIGALSNAGDLGKVYDRDLNVTNVGSGAKLYLMNYGDDQLAVAGCSIDGASFNEASFDILEYTAADPRGCHVLVCDLIADRMQTTTTIPCLNYQNTWDFNETRVYNVGIDMIESSLNNLYIIIQGMSGRMSEPFNVGAMADSGGYNYDIETRDVGDVKAVFLVQLGKDDTGVVLVNGCTVDNAYQVNELTGDVLEYTASDLRGCAYIKFDFLNDQMKVHQQDICNIIPVIVDNGYFVSVDTTNIPFSKPGGTEDEIWLRITNSNGDKSEFVSLGNDMTDDGEVFSFRPTVKNIGSDISKMQFIQFGDDDLCIDYCQINAQSIDLGLFGAECNENDVNDNDACAILSCDFDAETISSTVESPCKQDVYGWNNKTYRVYTVVIEVCDAIGELVDTWSMDSFWIYLENVELDLLSASFKVDALGTDGENVFEMNTSNIGNPDKLYLVHYNNDDVCITDISVDGFTVSTFPFTASEYDCDYSADGCNVLTVDFETNEMNIKGEKECPFAPDDLDVGNDTCLEDIAQNWYDELFDLATLIGVISLIVVVVIVLCCVGGCIWLGYSIQRSNTTKEAVEMDRATRATLDN
eukprot:381360_1